jgi:pimeloyl-ACP methyl ester carboxylesterase
MKAEINGVGLYYELHGEGEPIIFLHGWLDDCTVWNPQVEPLTKKHMVISYDHRGHGRSDKPDYVYSVKTLANDLHALMQELDVGKSVVVGHSLGGMTALTFSLNHPDKVSRLVIVGTTAKTPFLMSAQAVLRYIIPYRTFVQLAQKSGYYKPSDQLISNSLDMAMNVPKYAAYSCLREFTRNYDLRHKVSKIEVPTLIVVGEKDKNTPMAASQYLNEQIGDSILRIIPDCGHEVMVEKPTEFSQVLGEFIE